MTSLAVFTAAVEGGSVAAAARRHKITPAMAGRHIDSLEQALKARLLQRTTRQLHLTDVGRAYYQRSRRILEEFEEAQREAGDLQVSPQGTLRITVSACFAALHMGAPIARYMREHPRIRVEMLASDNFVDLVHEGIDMAVRIGRLADSNLVARYIGNCRMVMCAAPSYLNRVGEPKTPSDLRKHPRLAFSEAVSPGDWTLRDARGRSHVIDGPCQLLSNSMQLLLAVAIQEGRHRLWAELRPRRGATPRNARASPSQICNQRLGHTHRRAIIALRLDEGAPPNRPARRGVW
jgi:DNA-binding transcriptional LysR family regulator